MAKETTDAGKLGSWHRLLAALEANAGDLTYLEVPRARLESLLTRAVEISTQQAARMAAKQEASKELRALITEGERLSTVLRFAVKERYGIRSEKLSEFSLQPFRGRKAKKGPEAPEAPVLDVIPPGSAPAEPVL